ncbi:MAG TPA: molybdopterin biosynthesis protein [Vicinamibacterales bacterium]|nr:molybdopterin biosynthesis protein [Vicinamibacterales bacterium]
MREPPFATGFGGHEQEQFLQVLDRDEAERRFRAAVDLAPRGIEQVALDTALGRVLASDVTSPVDVPSFDRSNVDGFAVVAEDTFGASEEVPRRVRLLDEVIHTGIVPATIVRPGEAVAIATGGMMPRGADAVVMIEHAEVGPPAAFALSASAPKEGGHYVRVSRAVTAGSGVSFAATDITAGETVLRGGQILTSRDTGVLAAIGVAVVDVWRKPIVAILSTGDEIIAPGEPMRPARIYDSNAQILADAVRELGGEPLRLGITPDDPNALRAKVREALGAADIVLLSGGTSKGAGDVSYRVVAELTDPGIVAHGVALKPGKPICLAATGGRPVVVLPGFPTSAIFTFHEFVAPVLSAMAGRSSEKRATVQARLAVRVNSEIGRTEYLLVGLVETADSGLGTRDSGLAARDSRLSESGTSSPESRVPSPGLAAYPMGQGSGSVTTFSRADGFTTIDRHQEIVPAGTMVAVQLLGRELRLADLVVIGSHCVGLDYLLGELQKIGVRSKFLAVGSLAGLEAAKRGECDLAGVHLLDPQSGEYNRPFLTPALELIPGYGRLQGIVFRTGDARFEGRTPAEAMAIATADPSCVMINRNQGSGTRTLIDRLLAATAKPLKRDGAKPLEGDGAKPPKGDGAAPLMGNTAARPAGHAIQPRTHNAVAAAVVQGRADWGVTLDTIACSAGLGFIPVQHEQYDFVVSKGRAERPGVTAFRARLADPTTRDALVRLGMKP